MNKLNLVAPRTGAWIETGVDLIFDAIENGRPPHGGVD